MMRDTEKTIGKMIDKMKLTLISYINSDGFPISKAMLSPRERNGIKTFWFSTNTSSNKVETMQTKIKLRIHKSVMDMVLEFCSYGDFSPDGDEHYMVSFPFIENDYYNILFGFGDKCECLEPVSIRTEMKRRIHNIAYLYEN